MKDEIYNNYLQAGRIAAEARDTAAARITSGVSFLEIVQLIESIIEKNHAKPAFPANIAVNNTAAHFTPLTNDTHHFHSGDIVKIDVGVHIDGYIADTALTIEVDSEENSSLIQASSEALTHALNTVKPGVSPASIGKIVEKTIKEYKVKPITNLTGHSMQRFNLHAGLSIPNIAAGRLQRKIKIDDVIAIEPFATNGGGKVISKGKSNIYRLHHRTTRGMRETRAKLMFSRLYKAFKTLPFSYRWCEPLITHVDPVLQRLMYLGMVTHYPQLLEVDHGLVSQKEHTIIVTADGCQITTLGEHDL